MQSASVHLFLVTQLGTTNESSVRVKAEVGHSGQVCTKPQQLQLFSRAVRPKLKSWALTLDCRSSESVFIDPKEY
jgi:hypothetical protein